MSWTTPYHGVQHLNGLKKGWQVTVVARCSFAEAYVLPPGTFTTCDQRSFDTAAEACVWAERRALELHITE